MARYFFNVRYKLGLYRLAVDPDGDDFANIDQVREHALTMARDLIERTRLDSIRNWFDCSFEITDEQGRAVMSVPFTDIVQDESED